MKKQEEITKEELDKEQKEVKEALRVFQQTKTRADMDSANIKLLMFLIKQQNYIFTDLEKSIEKTQFILGVLIVILAILAVKDYIYNFVLIGLYNYILNGFFLFRQLSPDQKFHIFYIAPLTLVLGYIGYKIKKHLFK